MQKLHIARSLMSSSTPKLESSQAPKAPKHKSGKQLSQRDMAGILGIDTKTLYNWKKHKPNLYRIVMLGFKFDELLECSKRNYAELLEIEAHLT